MLETISANYIIPLAYICFGVAIVSVLGFTVIQMIRDLKGAKMTLIGVGIAAAIFFVCFLMANNQPFGDVSATQMRLVDATIYMFYVLLAGSGVAIIVFSVLNYFK